MLRGEAGIGKSRLLEYLESCAHGCGVARTTGIESEMELAYAGLHQLCGPFLHRVDRLPEPQRDALEAAFGVREGHAPDHFLIGLATLSLLSEAAEERPLVCLVDDVHWLDQASAAALAFVARRLFAESVLLVLSTRRSDEDDTLRSLPGMHVAGLGERDAETLLRSTLRGPVDPFAIDGLLAEARGNPLALLELSRGRTSTEIVFGLGKPGTLPVAGRMEQGFVQRLRPLPADTGRLLLVAAVETTGDVTLLRRAAERLGLEPDAAVPAVEAELIEIGARVRFRHPLVRSAVWRSADVSELKQVHGVLAEVGDLDPDRTAWHRAQASTAPDEDVAAELERSGDRARARGGLTATAAFLERAAELTPDPVHRTARLLTAAQAKLQAGEFASCRTLVALAEGGPIDELGRARIDQVRARLAYASRRSGEVPSLLLAAAERLEPLDLELARTTCLEALAAVLYTGRFAGATMLDIAAAAQRVASEPGDKRGLLLNGLVTLIVGRHRAALPTLRPALRAYGTEEIPVSDGLECLSITSVVAADVWDDEAFRVLSSRYVATARDVGALSELLRAINISVISESLAGEYRAASVLVDEARAVMDALGSERPNYAAMVLRSWEGDEGDACALIEARMSEVVARGEGTGVSVAQWAAAVLFNGLCRYEDAVTAARRASEDLHELAAAKWGLAELVEACVRAGAVAEASDALERLSETTQACGTDWALGVEARCRALLTWGEAADEHHRDAIERLSRTRCRAELARAHLVYGEWLRRAGRRSDAREQLRTAHEQFTMIGAGAFAERARRELLATGETVRRRPTGARHGLTAQEVQVARLAAAGRTNSEIGAHLFISPRTVEWHLRKAFGKLGISSRREMSAAMADLGDTFLPA